MDVTPHPAQGNQVASAGGGALEDNPEWEYLRNILYEYMCGRQPLILAKAGNFLYIVSSSSSTFSF